MGEWERDWEGKGEGSVSLIGKASSRKKCQNHDIVGFLSLYYVEHRIYLNEFFSQAFFSPGCFYFLTCIVTF